MSSGDSLSRRQMIQGTAAVLAAGAAATQTSAAPAVDDVDHQIDPNGPVHQVTGVRIGEVSADSAMIWARLTADTTRRNDGVRMVGHGKRPLPDGMDLSSLEGACPGRLGQIRVRYGTDPSLQESQAVDWVRVDRDTDYAHTFPISGLQSDTQYHFAVETTTGGISSDHKQNLPHGPLTGRFRTAPAAGNARPVRFAVVTCFMYAHLDDPKNGFNLYPAVQKLDPHFIAYTGDNVYYDSDHPEVTSPELARYHWQRMYSLPRHVELLRNVPSYWEKDDHDLVSNDCWPGMKAGTLTYELGQQIFRQQCPLGPLSYRTFRWGKDLQVWLSDGRDFRSSNKAPDGPKKTIWGAEQKAWFKKTVAESDATWKVLISPTPVIGPDRGNKNDNHANDGFRHEGDELRAFIAAQKNAAGQPNLFVVNGDRHWQYHSVEPQLGIHEFGCGPGSDQHASGSPGEDKAYHKFHRVKGGFLTVDVQPGEAGKGATIRFAHHDVSGKVVHEYTA